MTIDHAQSIAVGERAYQSRVDDWLQACFGIEIARDKEERNHRFLEEALELVQACGCTASEAHQLVDYTFDRPIGDKGQEVGGVMNTLAALCLAHGLDLEAEAETELARVWTKVEKIRAKQAAKPKHSPLPEAIPARRSLPSGAVTVTDEMIIEARKAIRYLSHPETPWSDEQVRTVLNAALSAATPSDPGNGEGARDLARDFFRMTPSEVHAALDKAPASQKIDEDGLVERLRDTARTFAREDPAPDRPARSYVEWEAAARIEELERERNQLLQDKERGHKYRDKLIARADTAEATISTLRAALEPFAAFAEHVDESGWTSSIHREAVSTWFGPSDFRRARQALSTPSVPAAMETSRG